MVKISSAALGKMSVEERNRFLETVYGAPADSLRIYLTVLDAQLRVFEERYEIESSELHNALSRGTLPDTREINEWLVLVDVRGQVAREART